MLGNLLDKEIEEVCFPMGYFSDKVIRYAKESGYKLLFSSMRIQKILLMNYADVCFFRP